MSTVSINSIAVPQAGPASWTSRSGFEPSMAEFLIPNSSLGLLPPSSQRNRMTLTIGARTIKNLRLVAIGPGVGAAGNERAFTMLRLADRRFDLTTRSIDCGYNLRRRTGTGTLDPSSDAPPQVRSVIPEEEYYPSTLNKGNPYTAREIIADLLGRAGLPFATISGAMPSGDIIGGSGLRARGTIASVLGSLMTSIPGWSFGLDDDGVGHFYPVDGIADTLAKLSKLTASGSVFSGGYFGTLDRSGLRPSITRVHFQVAAEMRFDYLFSRDQEFALTSPAPLVPGEVPAALLESLIPCPVNDMPYLGARLARGSLLNLYAFLSALQSAADSGEIPLPIVAEQHYGPISDDRIRFFYFKRELMQNAYCYDHVSGSNVANQLYLTIWNSVLASWRLLFRISREWAPYVLSVSEDRVGFLDTISQSRRKTSVWGSYLGFPTERLVSTRTRGDYNGSFMRSVFSPNSSTSRALDSFDSAPVDIRVIDQDAKVLQTIPRRGQYGDVADYIPGEIPEDRMPKVINASNLAIALGRGDAELSSDWTMATILTLTPVPSPSQSHLYTIEISPSDLDDKFRIHGIDPATIGECLGPPLDIFVAPEPQTMAQFAYSSSDESALAKPFFDPLAKWPESALVNRSQLAELAKAYAVSHYAALRDVVDGSATIPNLAGQDLRLAGSFHSAMTDPMFHRIYAGPTAQPADPLSYTSLTLREELMRRIK